MKLSFEAVTLDLAHPFTLATSSRVSTPVVFTRVECDGLTGYGEGAMPPYLGESHASAVAFLQRIDLRGFSLATALDDVVSYVDSLADGHCAAKAAVDIALHDLHGKACGRALHDLWGLDRSAIPFTSYTIGICDPDTVRQRVRHATGFRMLKLKLGGEYDRETVSAVREVTDVPLCVDVNQGWTDRERALDAIAWLGDHGVVFVEQPLPAGAVDDTAWLRERSRVPIIGDESIRRLPDIAAARDVFTGVNIKLAKAGGLLEARRMIEAARRNGLRVLLGCMTESSCGISAASQLAPLADWADLDGALLLAADPFCGAQLVDGRVMPTTAPGIGAWPR